MSAPQPRAGVVRRSLSHVGGEVSVEGDAVASAALAAAVSVPTSEAAEELARAHVHGFHTYPARMHPLTARRLVESFSAAGDTVLDPFCGSGTVVVEARLAGRRAIGVDANPLAVRLAHLKVAQTSQAARAAWIEAAREVAAFADARRQARAGATHRYEQQDVELFAPHTLLEMDSLRAGIDRLESSAARETLELVLSAILTKVSRRTGDTSEEQVEKRIAAGYPARLFVRKTEELVARLGDLQAASRGAIPPAVVLEGDARALDGVEDSSVALAVTSPPYPGNYDYLAHHAARLRWLRLPADRFDRAEMGARRRLDPLGAAGIQRWQVEMGTALGALHRVLAANGQAVLLLADSVVAGTAVYAVDLVRAVAPRAGFELCAVASQFRPYFHAATARAFGRRPRGEHAILLRIVRIMGKADAKRSSAQPATRAAEARNPPATQRVSTIAPVENPTGPAKQRKVVRDNTVIPRSNMKDARRSKKS